MNIGWCMRPEDDKMLWNASNIWKLSTNGGDISGPDVQCGWMNPYWWYVSGDIGDEGGCIVGTIILLYSGVKVIDLFDSGIIF